MRTCFIHLGLHKTATKSVQIALSEHARELARDGYHYPRTGRPRQAPAGHHNLAWEISQDRRFRRKYGNALDLCNEITRTDRHVIISTEDFECSLHHREKFRKFVASIQNLGVVTCAIVFLRNQIEYAESLYLTLVMLGYSLPFAEFCEEILQTGKVHWRESIFAFRYDVFLEQLAQVPGLATTVRSYDAPAGETPVGDFLSVIGLASSRLLSTAQQRHNTRLPLSTTLRRYLVNRGRNETGNHTGRGLLRRLLIFQRGSAAVPDFVDRLRGAQLLMPVSCQMRFAEAFREPNRLICREFGLAPFTRLEPERFVSFAGPSLSDVFATEDKFLWRQS